jgi:ATP-dependent RNA helicase DDX46/PRP5
MHRRPFLFLLCDMPLLLLLCAHLRAQSGYPCLSLHGGKEQSDRECTIADFKGAVCNILVATSVAARGLDVRELVLVVNYDVPNHHEDYVHRCGTSGTNAA